MLRNLFIKNFILIKSLDIDISTSGLTVVSGETGSGKSILLDALVFCLGGKIDANPDDAEIVTVCAEFIPSQEVINFLSLHDIEIQDQLIIKRTQHCGRKKFFISDQPVTQKLLQELSGLLLEMHGQHAHTLLGNAQNHQKILDEYAGVSDELIALKNEYGLLRDLHKKMEELQQHQESMLAEIDYLTHLVHELERADIQKNEEQELAEKKQLAKKKQQLIQRLETIEHYLQYDNICSAIVNAQKDIARYFDEPLSHMYGALERGYNEFESATQELQNFKQQMLTLEDDEDIEDRLYLIRDLARKYQVAPADLPNFLVSSREKLAQLSSTVAGKEELACTISDQQSTCMKLAQNLSRKRREAADKLQHRISEEFALLHMKGAKFVVEIVTDSAKLKSNGYDNVRFVACTNQGSPLSPIDKIASGGELSRFMLAIKIALLERGSMQTIIFDEIDTGVGGAAASSVGSRLAALGQSAQVIVITHQAQVAVFAGQHFKVSKVAHAGQTVTFVAILDHDSTEQEIARMLSGAEITEKSVLAAQEMRKQAQQ